jgi:hypothetical protein
MEVVPGHEPEAHVVYAATVDCKKRSEWAVFCATILSISQGCSGNRPGLAWATIPIAMPRKSRKKTASRTLQTARELRSGDPLVDWFFRQFVHALCTERIRVVRKRRLVNPDDPHHRVIRGLMDPDSCAAGDRACILINPARTTHRNRNEETETMIHELAHVLLPHTPERGILAIENIMTTRLTDEQRAILKTFLPRHEVKRYPRGAVATV